MKFKGIVVEISGGLGNQLFQLAAAVDLNSQGHKVIIDSIHNEINSFRATEINEIAKALSIPMIKRSVVLITCLRVPIVKRMYISRLRKKTLYEDISFGKPIIPVSSKDLRLFGYWQSISLANEIQDALSEFLKAPPIDGIALHIRRGDYLSKEHSLHGALDGNYYLKALAKLNQNRKNQKIMIFTDSPEIVKKEEWVHLISSSNVSFSNSTAPWETLMEMSRYSAIICSNSTFSWWAAFTGKEKEVILPSRWFRDTLLPAALRIEGSQIIESSFV